MSAAGPLVLQSVPLVRMAADRAAVINLTA
jgi:hypothetical protein